MSRDDYGNGRRRRFDEEDDCGPPRRNRRPSRDEFEPGPRQPKNRGGISPVVLGLVVGGVALGVLIVATVLYFAVFRDTPGPSGLLGRSPPAGYSVVPGDMAGFTCYLPGKARSIRVAFNGVPGDQAGIYAGKGKCPAEMRDMPAQRRIGFPGSMFSGIRRKSCLPS